MPPSTAKPNKVGKVLATKQTAMIPKMNVNMFAIS